MSTTSSTTKATAAHPLRIALGYKARSGKDEFYTTMQELYAEKARQNPSNESKMPEITRVAFADKLREIASGVQTHLAKPVEKDPKLMQTLGAGLRILYDADVFIDAVRPAINEATERGDIVVVTDMRYPNEMIALRDMGFVTVCINRPDRPVDRDPRHESEIGLDGVKFDYTIHNVGTLEEYKQKISNLLDFLNASG